MFDRLSRYGYKGTDKDYILLNVIFLMRDEYVITFTKNYYNEHLEI